MTPDRLLELYDEFSDAPGAVERLRRFVLDLAMRGMLAEPQSGGKSAQELIAEIEREKKVKCPYPVERGDKPGSLLFSLPANWAWVPALFPCRVISAEGKNVPVKNLLATGPYPVVDQGKTFIRGYWDDPSLVVKVQKSFILFGDHTRETKYIDFDFIVGADGLKIFEPIAVYDKFLYLAMFWLPIESRGYGRHFKILKASWIPLPPLSDQVQIVAKVDELMGLCDELEAAEYARSDTRRLYTKSVLHNSSRFVDFGGNSIGAGSMLIDEINQLSIEKGQFDMLRQFIISAGVSGALSVGLKCDQSAEVLLEETRVKKLQLKQTTADSRIKSARSPSNADYPGDIPAHWAVESFENLFLFIDYRGKTPEKTKSGIPLITAKNVKKGYLSLKPREFIHPSTYPKWMTRGLPQYGDLFFTTEAPLGNVCVNTLVEPFALAQRVICLRPYHEIDSQFFTFVIMSSHMQTYINSESSGMTATGIKSSKLKPLALPVPPLEEQKFISTRILSLLKTCDELEEAVNHRSSTRVALMVTSLAASLK
ncbi:MAG: restriction endonuclease subunit S [Fimbriimonadaceae bacterium]|nr:MAG: restriction endonuclease subunit S [Fimbriimonadaceae bacterium]